MSTATGREAAFIGKITAGATHEIRNVLAIIKESAGLVEDLLHQPTTRGPLDRERVLKALGRIEAQVARGAEIATHLNRVAHAPDHELASIDLDEEIRRVVFHAQRSARRKSQTVRAADGGAPASFPSRPLRVQMAVYTALEACLERCVEGATIEVLTGAPRSRPSVTLAISPRDAVPADEADWNALRHTLADLGVSLEEAPEGDGLTLLFEPDE